MTNNKNHGQASKLSFRGFSVCRLSNESPRFLLSLFNIFTTDGLAPDMTYNLDENVGWWEKNWLQVILNALQIIAGFLLCFVPCMQGIGKMLIFAGMYSKLNLNITASSASIWSKAV